MTLMTPCPPLSMATHLVVPSQIYLTGRSRIASVPCFLKFGNSREDLGRWNVCNLRAFRNWEMALKPSKQIHSLPLNRRVTCKHECIPTYLVPSTRTPLLIQSQTYLRSLNPSTHPAHAGRGCIRGNRGSDDQPLMRHAKTR